MKQKKKLRLPPPPPVNRVSWWIDVPREQWGEVVRERQETNVEPPKWNRRGSAAISDWDRQD